MSTELYLAQKIISGRTHSNRDQALLRDVELALEDRKRARRGARRDSRS